MKLHARLILKTASAVFTSVAVFPDLAFAAETGSETTSVREKVAGLVSQLGSDEYSARENAEKKLAAMGEEAVSVLKTLPKSNDAEANIRIDRILIQFSIAGAKTVA